MSIEPLAVGGIIEAAQGVLMGDAEKAPDTISDVIIDSRAAKPGSLYIPIIGERFDGHSFIGNARAQGAGLVLSDRELDGDDPYVLVHDTLDALQAVARLHRQRFSPFVVAVTGSAGKTTTKEMTALVLSSQYETVKTEGNLNNQTGVPQMLFSLDGGTQAAVFEMGMNHAGEISRLAGMVLPSVLIVTNIGTAHIEYLGSREGILSAKLEAVPFVQAGGTLILNGDDELLACEAPSLKAGDSLHAILFGMGNGCDVRAVDVRSHGLEGTSFRVEAAIAGKACSFHVRLGCPGEYLVYSALSAAAAGLVAHVPVEKIAQALAQYQPVGSRMRIVHHGGLTVLDDTYNANLPATQAALSVLAQAEGAKIAILGEMRELGEQSESLHEQAVESALESGARMVACVGPLYKEACAKAWRRGPVLWFETQDELLEVLDAQLDTGDTVLVKGSRGMHMERTVRHLAGEATAGE